MQKQIYNIYKPLGLTPLESLEKFREMEKLPSSLKMSYAGRLDPMAEGVLILVCGNKLQEKEKFLKLNKVYRAQILFGASTDTFDLLGKVIKLDGDLPEIDDIKIALKNFSGKITLPIPPYSSVPILGKPSFTYARSGELDHKNMQKREMEIKKIVFRGSKKITANTLLKIINKKITKVNGDFRQKEILKLWEKKLACHCEEPRIHLRSDAAISVLSNRNKDCFGCTRNDKFLIIDLTISCASGTYIRSIAHTLGKNLKQPALLYNLIRESVGKYKIDKSIKI